MKVFCLKNLTAAFVGLSLAACGENNLDQLRHDFENPTGDTTDKNSLIALNGKRSATGASGSAGLAAGGGFGLGLTAEGRHAPGFRRIAPRVMFEREVGLMRSIITGTKQSGLRSQESIDAEDCVDQQAIAASLSGIDPVNGGDGSFEYSVDLEACTRGALTGKMDVEGEFEISRTHGEFRISQTMHNVCERDGSQACISGSYLIEMVMDASEGSRTASFEMLAGWDLQASWVEDGDKISAHVKGGVRLAASGNESLATAEFEYLYYVTTEDGQEVSFTLSITADSNGEATMTIKGRDGGVIECTYSEMGGGSCKGPNGEISWEEAEEQAIYEADWFRS